MKCPLSCDCKGARVRLISRLDSSSPVAQTVKSLPAGQETQVPSLGGEDPLEKGMATHSSILAGRIPRQSSLEGYIPWVAKSRTRLND